MTLVAEARLLRDIRACLISLAQQARCALDAQPGGSFQQPFAHGAPVCAPEP
jgi:hypothetical protein